MEALQRQLEAAKAQQQMDKMPSYPSGNQDSEMKSINSEEDSDQSEEEESQHENSRPQQQTHHEEYSDENDENDDDENEDDDDDNQSLPSDSHYNQIVQQRKSPVQQSVGGDQVSGNNMLPPTSIDHFHNNGSMPRFDSV